MAPWQVKQTALRSWLCLAYLTCATLSGTTTHAYLTTSQSVSSIRTTPSTQIFNSVPADTPLWSDDLTPGSRSYGPTPQQLRNKERLSQLMYQEWRETFGLDEEPYDKENFKAFQFNVLSSQRARDLQTARAKLEGNPPPPPLELNAYADCTPQEYKALKRKEQAGLIKPRQRLSEKEIQAKRIKRKQAEEDLAQKQKAIKASAANDGPKSVPVDGRGPDDKSLASHSFLGRKGVPVTSSSYTTIPSNSYRSIAPKPQVTPQISQQLKHVQQTVQPETATKQPPKAISPRNQAYPRTRPKTPTALVRPDFPGAWEQHPQRSAFYFPNRKVTQPLPPRLVNNRNIIPALQNEEKQGKSNPLTAETVRTFVDRKQQEKNVEGGVGANEERKSQATKTTPASVDAHTLPSQSFLKPNNADMVGVPKATIFPKRTQAHEPPASTKRQEPSSTQTASSSFVKPDVFYSEKSALNFTQRTLEQDAMAAKKKEAASAPPSEPSTLKSTSRQKEDDPRETRPLPPPSASYVKPDLFYKEQSATTFPKRTPQHNVSSVSSRVGPARNLQVPPDFKRRDVTEFPKRQELLEQRQKSKIEVGDDSDFSLLKASQFRGDVESATKSPKKNKEISADHPGGLFSFSKRRMIEDELPPPEAPQSGASSIYQDAAPNTASSSPPETVIPPQVTGSPFTYSSPPAVDYPPSQSVPPTPETLPKPVTEPASNPTLPDQPMASVTPTPVEESQTPTSSTPSLQPQEPQQPKPKAGPAMDDDRPSRVSSPFQVIPSTGKGKMRRQPTGDSAPATTNVQGVDQQKKDAEQYRLDAEARMRRWKESQSQKQEQVKTAAPPTSDSDSSRKETTSPLAADVAAMKVENYEMVAEDLIAHDDEEEEQEEDDNNSAELEEQLRQLQEELALAEAEAQSRASVAKELFQRALLEKQMKIRKTDQEQTALEERLGADDEPEPDIDDVTRSAEKVEEEEVKRSAEDTNEKAAPVADAEPDINDEILSDSVERIFAEGNNEEATPVAEARDDERIENPGLRSDSLAASSKLSDADARRKEIEDALKSDFSTESSQRMDPARQAEIEAIFSGKAKASNDGRENDPIMSSQSPELSTPLTRQQEIEAALKADFNAAAKTADRQKQVEAVFEGKMKVESRGTKEPFKDPFAVSPSRSTNRSLSMSVQDVLETEMKFAKSMASSPKSDTTEPSTPSPAIEDILRAEMEAANHMKSTSSVADAALSSQPLKEPSISTDIHDSSSESNAQSTVESDPMSVSGDSPGQTIKKDEQGPSGNRKQKRNNKKRDRKNTTGKKNRDGYGNR